VLLPDQNLFAPCTLMAKKRKPSGPKKRKSSGVSEEGVDALRQSLQPIEDFLLNGEDLARDDINTLMTALDKYLNPQVWLLG